MTDTQRSGLSAKMAAATVVVGLMGSGALVWQASSAAFTASTSNDDNTWASGKVVLSDNDSDSALFTASGLVPLDTDTNCIEVTYSGNVDSTVKLYGANLGGTGLDQYLDLDVEMGDADDTCASADGWAQIFGDAATTLVGDNTDTLNKFGTTYTNFSNGISGGWTPSAAATRAYRFTWTLGNNNSAQDKTAEIDFVWEVQNN